MKKILLSFFVVGVFIFYALSQSKSSSADNQSNNPSQFISDNNSAITITDTQTGTTKSQTYKDGEYIGNVTDAFYGNIQVKTVIKNSKITDVIFLTYPNDRSTSIEINTQVMPKLKFEAITAQSAQVDIVSGATQTSEAFIKSLQSALNQAKS